MRFVKAIGYDSFKQFKLELAKNYDKENNIDIFYGFSINTDDKIMDLPGKIVATANIDAGKCIKISFFSELSKP